jgi:hypothetical protein
MGRNLSPRLAKQSKGGYFKMHTHGKILWVGLVFLALLLQGCAVGNKYNLIDARLDLQTTPAKVRSVAVATSDQRAVVQSHECHPTYIGMQRAGFGNPWRVNTESGLPLADDLTKVVSESLSQKGYKSLPVSVKYVDDHGIILELLRECKVQRSLLFIIKKWESDTYMNIGLDYEIELTVYDEAMSKLAAASVAKTYTLPGSFWDPPSAARREIPLAFKNALETLLNDPRILLALM